MTSQKFWTFVVKHVIDRLGSYEDNVLACMIVLHTQDILVRDECEFEDVVWPVGTTHRLHAITRRHASEIVAASTGHESEQDAIDKWYALYCTHTPFEVIDSAPQPMKDRVYDVIECVRNLPLVVSVVDAQ